MCELKPLIYIMYLTDSVNYLLAAEFLKKILLNRIKFCNHAFFKQRNGRLGQHTTLNFSNILTAWINS